MFLPLVIKLLEIVWYTKLQARKTFNIPFLFIKSLFRLSMKCHLHKLLKRTYNLSRCIIKPTICLCQNKGADQICGNRKADQCLCFRYMGSIIPLINKSKISNLLPSSVLVQLGLCRTCLETTLLVFSCRGSYNL